MPNNPDIKLPWWRPLALFTALLMSSYAAADVQVGDANLSGIAVGELGQVQSQTILFNAQAARAEAQRSIRGASSSSSQALNIPEQTQGTSAAMPTTSSQPDLPVIKAITGTSHKMRATLLFSSGVEVEAVTGARDLPGGFRVAQINLEGVVLERSGERFLLGFSDRVPGSVGLAPSPSQPAMPGLAPRQY